MQHLDATFSAADATMTGRNPAAANPALKCFSPSAGAAEGTTSSYRSRCPRRSRRSGRSSVNWVFTLVDLFQNCAGTPDVVLMSSPSARELVAGEVRVNILQLFFEITYRKGLD
jgi:hypothetical protein